MNYKLLIFSLSQFSYLFWTDWGLKTVQRASLDGKNIKTLINSSLNFVNGITINFDNDRIYWVDAHYDKIESSTFEGLDRKQIAVQGVRHPFGITIFKNEIYWTDWATFSIHKASIDGSNQQVVKSGLRGIMDVCVFDRSRQPAAKKNGCGVNNGGCPELCFWNGTATHCACRSGFTFNSKTRKCEQNAQFLVYASYDSKCSGKAFTWK